MTGQYISVNGLKRARESRKPVVIMKVGQSTLGQAAALSHTASIAGDDRVLDDVVLHRCPFGEDVALQMIRRIKGAALLLGARGKPEADVNALARMLARLSALAVAAAQGCSQLI